jgi:adenosylhomocysteinase
MIVRVTEIDPICAMQACMDGYEVVSPYIERQQHRQAGGHRPRLLATPTCWSPATGNTNVCDSNMLQTLKKGAVVCNIGHFDNEIDTAFMRKHWRWDKVKPRCTRSSAATTSATT